MLKRPRKTMKLKKAESQLRLFAKSPPPGERRSTSKNRTTAKSNPLNITLAKPISTENTAKRKKKKNGVLTAEQSKANLIIRKALEVLKKEENERKRSEEKDTKERMERINKSKVYASLVRHKNEKITRANGSGHTADNKDKWAWGVDQRKFILKRNGSDKTLNLKGLTLHEATEPTSTHRRHSASKERKSSNIQLPSAIEFTKKSSISKIDKKDDKDARKKDDTRPRKTKTDKRPKAADDECLPKTALATAGCFSTSTSGGFRTKHVGRVKGGYSGGYSGVGLENEKVSAAVRARDKLLERLEGQLKLQIFKHQPIPLVATKRSKSKERTFLMEPFGSKPRRLKKTKRARKRERNIGKVQLTKRANDQGGKPIEERLDMISKYPADKKINSSASSDIQSDEERARDSAYSKEATGSGVGDTASQKGKLRSNAADKLKDRQKKFDQSSQRRDTESSQKMPSGPAVTEGNEPKGLLPEKDKVVSYSVKGTPSNDKQGLSKGVLFEGTLPLEKAKAEPDIDLVGSRE